MSKIKFYLKPQKVQPEEEAEGREEGFTQDSATKALILLIEYLKKQRKTFERGLEEYIRILVLPVLPGVLADKSVSLVLLINRKKATIRKLYYFRKQCPYWKKVQ